MAAANYEMGTLVTADVAFDRALFLASRTGIRVPFHTVPRITMLRLLNRAADRYQPDPGHRLPDELRAGSAATAELAAPPSDRELDIPLHLVQDQTAAQTAATLSSPLN